MKTLDFSTADGTLVGSVTVTDAGELQPDPLLRSVAQSWQDKGRSPAEFVKFYDGWSNGYMIARTRDEQENVPMAKPAPLGSGGRFAALKKKLAAKGDTTDPAAVAASIGRKKYGSAAMQAMAAKGRKKNT